MNAPDKTPSGELIVELEAAAEDLAHVAAVLSKVARLETPTRPAA